jgi:hypothetical protein
MDLRKKEVAVDRCRAWAECRSERLKSVSEVPRREKIVAAHYWPEAVAQGLPVRRVWLFVPRHEYGQVREKRPRLLPHECRIRARYSERQPAGDQRLNMLEAAHKLALELALAAE